MRLKLIFAVAFLLVAQRASLLQAAGSAAVQASDPATALSGGWKLNMDASTNPNGPDGPGAKVTAKPGGQFSTPNGPPPGGDLGKEELQRFNAHLAMFRKAPPLLGIKATDKEVTLAYDPDPAKGMIYKYMTDGKKSVMTTPAGPLDIKVKWNGKTLRREIESKESLKVVEEYVPSADGKQLTVTVDISNVMVRMVKTEIKRVYDRVQ
jgi:hypothetical protein